MVEGFDHSAAKETLVAWLAAWQACDWAAMAALTASSNPDLQHRTELVRMNFHHRMIVDYDEPVFEDCDQDIQSEDDSVMWADFSVSVALTERRGSESFVARVIGVGSSWAVSAASTTKRASSSSRKGQQCQRAMRESRSTV